MLRSLSSLLLVLPLAVTAGCPGGELTEGEGEGEEGEGDGGEGEGEGEGEEGEGEGEPPPPPPPPPPPDNDSCATAEDVSDGGDFDGTTVNASNDTPCPDFSDPMFPEGGEDVAYTFTIAEPSGVRLSVVDEFFGATVSLFSDAGCGAGGVTPDDERTCVVGNGDSTDIVVGELAAGTYFVVVESPFFAGDFTLSVDIGEPFCVGDIADEFERGFDPVVVGNETAVDAVALNGNGSLGSISRNSDTAAEEQFDVLLCDGDVDYYLVGHLGGLMTLGLSGTGAEAELREAVIDVEASKAASNVIYAEGDVVAGIPGADVDVPAGLYLLKVTENQTLVGAQNIEYDVAVTHQCEADDFDIPNAALDDFFELQQEPLALPLDTPVERTICGADTDIIVLDVIFDGELAITFAGDTGRDLSVSLFSVDDDGVETEIAANAFDDADNNVLVVSTDVVAGRVIARISGNGVFATGAYNWNVAFPGLTGVPDNDACGDATVVVANAGLVSGRTVGATDDFVEGTCNFQFDDEVAKDVFFRFTIDDAIDTQLSFQGIANYSGSFGLFKLPGGTCPADLADLDVVTVAGVDFFGDPTEDPACVRAGDVVRLPALPAGEYLGIVDDSTFGGPGVFRVGVDTFVGGFPPPPACNEENINLVELEVGVVQTFEFTGADFFPGELEAADCSSPGNEKVLSFTASQSGTLIARTLQGGTNDFDTVVMLRTDCLSDAGEACDDDGNGGGDLADAFDSILETDVVAGTTYFVVVDSFSSFSPSLDEAVTVELVLNP